MKLQPSQKINLLKTAKNVYQSYVALDVFKSYQLPLQENKKNTLFEECQALLETTERSKDFLINNVYYKLSIVGNGPEYKVNFKRIIGRAQSKVKQITEYSGEEFLDLLADQQFVVEKQEEKFYLGNQIQDNVKIGGIGKIDLYRTHLSTLYNIIEKIESEEDVSNLLVALAAGSGKTFVQALWMLILNMSGNNAIFAVPDKLVHQFKQDLSRLLPDELVTNIAIIRQGEKKPQDEALIDDLSKEDGKPPKIILTSSEQLLDDHYQSLSTANPQKTFLSFDEQHLLMKDEKRRIRLLELSKHMLTMFLTATPNQETYDLAGRHPVAIMSSGQKQKSGQGQFPVTMILEDENIAYKNRLRTYKFWTNKFWQNIFRSLLLRFSNSIQEDHSSVGVSVVEQLPFVAHHRPNEQDPRWGLQVPMANKMLVIAANLEHIINFCASYKNPQNVYAYKDGNIVNRSDIANFFQLNDVEDDIRTEDRERKRLEYLNSLPGSEQEIGRRLSNNSLKDQARYNIFHAMMEYVLKDLTGLDEITHNRMRKNDPKAFQKLILKKLRESQDVKHDDVYFTNKLKSLIDGHGADEIGGILSDLYKVLHKYSEDFNSRDDFNIFVDNWSLDHKIADNIWLNNSKLAYNFYKYIESHLMICIMSGMVNAEISIKESKPFLGFESETYPMYQDGVLVDRAKKRKRTSLETLNDQSTETIFTPRYVDDLTEEHCDNYFRLGFVGAYISNKKTEGFSDRNLHTVINLTQEKLSPNNDPAALIQGAGRIRGLDETVVPTYIHARGRGDAATFDLNNLKKDDYYPDLFKAQKKYNKEFLAVLGERVGNEIIEWFNANIAPDNIIDEEQLRRQTLKIIAKALRDINDKNDHNIKLSRSQLTNVIGVAMKTLDAQIKQIKEPYKISLFIRVLGSILNFIAETYYTFKRRSATVKVSQFRSPDNKSSDEVYVKILKNLNYKKIIEKANIAREFQSWLMRSAKGIEYRVAGDLDHYLKQDINNQLEQHKIKFFWPMLAKFVVPEKRELVLQVLKNFPYILAWCAANKTTIQSMMLPNCPNFKDTALTIMRQIPELEYLTPDDMVDFPREVNAIVKQLKHESPLQIIQENAELRVQIVADLSKYIRGQFIKNAEAFFTVSDYQQVKKILATGTNAEDFLNDLLTSKGAYNDMYALITAFKNFFKLKDFATLDQRTSDSIDRLKDAIDVVFKNPMAKISEQKIEEIAMILNEQILPSLVNFYPIPDRQRLLDLANLENLKNLIRSEGTGLFAVTEPDEFAEFIFSKLNHDNVMPQQLNFAEESQRSKQLLTDGFTKIAQGYQSGLINMLMNLLQIFKIRKNPRDLLEQQTSNFIKSDDFLNAISLLIPYPDWLDLKIRITNDTAGTTNFTKALISIAEKNRAANIESSLDDQFLLKLINGNYHTQYFLTKIAAEAGVEKLRELEKLLNTNLVDSLSDEAITELSEAAHKNLLPILASFMKNQDNKEALVGLQLDKLKMVRYLYNNRDLLSKLDQLSSEEVVVIAKNLIDQLIDHKLTDNELIHPKIHGEVIAKKTSDDLKRSSMISYLTSEYFLKLIHAFFNQDDYESIRAVLADQAKVESIVERLIAAGLNTVNEDQLIALFKTEESLKDVQTLNDRWGAFKKTLDPISDNKLDSLDKNKLADSFVELYCPALFHKQFYSTFNELLGYLSTADLTTLLDKLGEANPEAKAEQISKFLTILKNQDKEALKTNFLTLPVTGVADLDQLPLIKTAKLVNKLLEEILDCHCYYNQHDVKGAQGSAKPPKILSHLSPELADIKVEANDSFWSGFSRKIFFIQSIRNGLPTVSEINGDSNRSRIKNLERVKNHLLRPLWWSISASNIGRSIVKSARGIVFNIQNAGFAILNIFKKIANLFVKNYFTISQRNLVSTKYNASAFEFSNLVNELTPFDAKEVNAVNCPHDVVKNLEATIPSKPIGSRFFAANNANIKEEHAHVSKRNFKN